MNLPIFNDFPPVSVEWVAADTETVTKVDGKVLPAHELYNAIKDRPRSWIYEHLTVTAYAWLISDGKHLAILPDAESFIDFLTVHGVSACWWYNAKFDFSFLDYFFLTHGWQNQQTGHLKAGCYRSLHSEFGSRYSLAHASEKRSKSRHKHAHVTTHYDLCNIFGGGLAAVLRSLDVRDFDGNPIRKKSMSYQADDFTPERIEYMRADAAGLYHAVRTASEYLKREYGLTLAGRRPDVLTAAGLSKRVFLHRWYKGKTPHDDAVAYIKHHQTTMELDKWLREHYILRGGLCVVNPAYRGKELQGVKMHRYDANQHYPARMSEMPDLYGTPRRYTFQEWQKNGMPRPCFFELSSVQGELRPGFVPVWYDPVTRDYTARPDFDEEEAGTTFFMWEDEFSEMQNWYSLTADITAVWVPYKRDVPFFRGFCGENYEKKRQGKKDGDPVKVAFAKLLNNGLGGKLSENPRGVTTVREINQDTGAVRLVETGQEETPTRLMSVMQGSYMMARARVVIMEKIREICGNVTKNFLYCDTDSVHALAEYPGADPDTLGAFKDEVLFTRVKYLAPKTYIDATDSTIDIHAKGVNLSAIAARYLTDTQEDYFRIQEERKAELPGMLNEKIQRDPETLDRIFNDFSEGFKVPSLSGLNIRGGKALLPLDKYVLRPEKQEDKEEMLKW